MSPRLAPVAGAAGAALVAVALPALAARSPLLRDFLVWLDPGLAPALFAVAIAGGIGAAARTWRAQGRFLLPSNAGGAVWRFDPAAALGPPAAMAIFLVPLLSVWARVPSDGCSVFGLLPWSDAGDYYRGAEGLLETGRLDEWNCRRPLNGALLAVRLALAGGDLQWTLVAQAALLCFAACVLAWAIGKDFGRPGGVLAFALLFAYSRPFLHWMTSECLGLTLGSLALAALWRGARGGRTAALGWGAAILTLALDARAGTFLVLPALVLWAGLAAREEPAFRWGAAAACAAGILLGILVNASVMKLYGGRFGMGHGNFSLTLYGLASGKPGWTQIYRDYPETRAMSEDAINGFAYGKSSRLLAEDPSRLWRSVALVSRRIVSEFPFYFARGWSLVPWRSARWAIVLFFGGGLVLFLARSWRRRDVSMVLASLAGFALSVPVLWADGGDRVYAATVPLFALLLPFGMSGWKRGAGIPGAGDAGRGRPSGARLPVLAGAILVAAAVAGPAAAHRLARKAPAFSPPPADGEWAIVSSAAPGIEIPARGGPETTFVPRVGRGDYFRNLPAFAKDDFRRLPGPGAVYYARNRLVPATDPSPGKFVWVVGPGGMARERPRYLRLRGTFGPDNAVFVVSDYTALDGGPGRPSP